MKHSEKVLSRLVEIMGEDDCDIITACAQFCEEHDLDPYEFIKSLDKGVVEKLKYDSIKANRVRKCVATLGPELL